MDVTLKSALGNYAGLDEIEPERTASSADFSRVLRAAVCVARGHRTSKRVFVLLREFVV